jgi:DNA-binding helix-hairpin-helix protein with protein kinase domain
MEIYKKVEYIHKDKAQKIYKDIAEKQFIMAFQGNAIDKLKADKLQRNRSRQRREEKQRSGRDAVPSQRHKQSAALLSFRNRP